MRRLNGDKVKMMVYIILRVLVVAIGVRQFVLGNYESVFFCALTLILFMVPALINKHFHIEFPNTLEIIILLFIFAAEILGEVSRYYILYSYWDTMLHTVNGFLAAAVGFALVDILNRSDKVEIELSPLFVVLTAFCFSMTIGVLWEFFEFGMDYFFMMDMQKDTVIPMINSVLLHPEQLNIPVQVVVEELIVNGEVWDYGGYIDIGLIDTMKDMFVNFIGAVIFSVFGYLYLKGGNKFIQVFLPRRSR